MYVLVKRVAASQPKRSTLCAQYIDSKNDIKREFLSEFFMSLKTKKRRQFCRNFFRSVFVTVERSKFGLLIDNWKAYFKNIRVRLRTQSVLTMFPRKEIKLNELPIKHIKIWHNSLTKITLILNYVQENWALRLPLPKLARFARKVGNTLSYSRENPWRQEANYKLFIYA